MALKSGQHLPGDDIEGILAVLDNDIYLLIPMIQRRSLQLRFSKYGILIQIAIFCAKIAEKHIKQKENQSAARGDYTKTYEERLPLCIFALFMTTSKLRLANDQCFESFMGELSAFLIDKECNKNVHKLISNFLSFKGEAEKFYPAFYKCISDKQSPFANMLKQNA